MEERKFIRLKKEEFGIKEYIKRDLGKGRISRLDIEYTPVGEKIIVYTSRPGLIIGKRGEKIQELTEILKKRFKLENPHIEIREIENPLFDAQLVADEIAMTLERMGNLKFKVIAYKKLQEIMNAGAMGCELRLTGKLPSERAKSWRFAEGYLKKAGESKKEVDRAKAVALTKTGIIGVKVAIMGPKARIYDKIDMDEIKGKIAEKIKKEEIEVEKPKEAEKIVKKKKKKPMGKKGEETIQEAVETKIKPEEDGTAIAIEQELEEGVPEGLDEELNELGGKIDKGKEISKEEEKDE